MPESESTDSTNELQWSGKGETLLLVEDQLVTRQAIQEILEMLNYRVLPAANGQEALGIFEHHKDEIALVISDVVMPQMGGVALLAALRTIKPETRMVLVTGYPMEIELLEGVVGRLRKPFRMDDIARTVRFAIVAL